MRARKGDRVIKIPQAIVNNIMLKNGTYYKYLGSAGVNQELHMIQCLTESECRFVDNTFFKGAITLSNDTDRVMQFDTINSIHVRLNKLGNI